MDKILLIIILGPIILGLVWAYQDKKRQAQILSDRLHNAENNITRLKNERLNNSYDKNVKELVIPATSMNIEDAKLLINSKVESLNISNSAAIVFHHINNNKIKSFDIS